MAVRTASNGLRPISARRFFFAPSMLTYDRPVRIWTGAPPSNWRYTPEPGPLTVTSPAKVRWDGATGRPSRPLLTRPLVLRGDCGTSAGDVPRTRSLPGLTESSFQVPDAVIGRSKVAWK